MDELIDALHNKEVKITFGLQPYHIEAIEKEMQRWRDMPPLASFPDKKVNPLYMKYVWDALGRQLGWCPFTLCLYYFEYLEERKFK
jgi:hypothetical protein